MTLATLTLRITVDHPMPLMQDWIHTLSLDRPDILFPLGVRHVELVTISDNEHALAAELSNRVRERRLQRIGERTSERLPLPSDRLPLPFDHLPEDDQRNWRDFAAVVIQMRNEGDL